MLVGNLGPVHSFGKSDAHLSDSCDTAIHGERRGATNRFAKLGQDSGRGYFGFIGRGHFGFIGHDNSFGLEKD
jgi:hypothetical protein